MIVVRSVLTNSYHQKWKTFPNFWDCSRKITFDNLVNFSSNSVASYFLSPHALLQALPTYRTWWPLLPSLQTPTHVPCASIVRNAIRRAIARSNAALAHQPPPSSFRPWSLFGRPACRKKAFLVFREKVSIFSCRLRTAWPAEGFGEFLADIAWRLIQAEVPGMSLETR